MGLLEEAEDRGGVEVEHLRAGELPIPHPVKAQRLHVEPLAVRSEAPLVPEHHDLLVGRGDDPRVHPPFAPGRLEGSQTWSKPVLSLACRAVAPQKDRP